MVKNNQKAIIRRKYILVGILHNSCVMIDGTKHFPWIIQRSVSFHSSSRIRKNCFLGAGRRGMRFANSPKRAQYNQQERSPVSSPLCEMEDPSPQLTNSSEPNCFPYLASALKGHVREQNGILRRKKKCTRRPFLREIRIREPFRCRLKLVGRRPP